MTSSFLSQLTEELDLPVKELGSTGKTVWQGGLHLQGLSWGSRSFCGQSFAAVKANGILFSLGGAICFMTWLFHPVPNSQTNRLGKDPLRCFAGLQ